MSLPSLLCSPHAAKPASISPVCCSTLFVRGIASRNTFRNNTDRRDFVERLSTLLGKTGTDCFAWALIPNHFHLLVRPNRGTLKPKAGNVTATQTTKGGPPEPA